VRGERYLTSDRQFQFVYDKGKSWASREVAVRTLPNGLDITRYGFAVGRRLGKAVVRNQIKRRLREILRHIALRGGWDIVIIARNPAAQVDYKRLKISVERLLAKAGLSLGEYEGVGSGVN
jgi:ribonuclease P protein component